MLSQMTEMLWKFMAIYSRRRIDMEKNSYNEGQSIVGIVVTSVVISLMILGGLYYYFSSQISEISEIIKKPVEEVVKSPKVTPLPERVDSKEKEFVLLSEEEILPPEKLPIVYILEDDGTLNSGDAMGLTKKFYERYPDHDLYDFISFHFLNGAPNGYTYSFKAKDSIQQGGFRDKVGNILLFPDGTTKNRSQVAYGSPSGRLLGGSVDSFSFNKTYINRDPNNDPIFIVDNYYFFLLFHEITHYWGVTRLELEMTRGIRADGGYDYAHWSNYIGSWISITQSTRKSIIEREGKYYFQLNCGVEPKHHGFDLYAMGLKSPETVKEKIVIYRDNLPSGSLHCGRETEIPAASVKAVYTIQDLINLLGPRIPSVEDSQKDFSIAFVLIVPKGATVNADEMSALNWIADKFPIAWYKSTEGLSTLNGIRAKDTTPPLISNVKMSTTKSSITISWTTNEPATPFVIYTPHGGIPDIIFPTIFTFPPNLSKVHTITINSEAFTPIMSNTEYPIKILSIDGDYNMSSFNAGNVKTK